MALSDIKKAKVVAPMITIVGTPGVGKTKLASLFPNPVFIQAEKITGVFDSLPEEERPDMFPVLPRSSTEKKVSTKDSILSNLRDLITEDHEYKTLVIDSVTSLHKMLEHEVCERYGVDNIGSAAGGYNKGYDEVAELHSSVVNACDALRSRKDMTIIFLAHAGIKKVRNSPDTDEYSVFSLEMHDKSVPYYVNPSDMVLYLRTEMFVKGVEKDKKGTTTKVGKVVNTDKRIIITSSDGRQGYVLAKNRYGLESEIELQENTNPLVDMIGYYKK